MSPYSRIRHRERLTEREDENRVEQPLRIPLGESVLLFSGDLEPRGDHIGVGEAFDLLLAIEDDERFQFKLSAGMYRPGSAFGAARPDWMWAGLLAVRVAF